MRPPRTSVELRVVAAGGRETRLRLGGLGGVAALGIVALLVAGLLAGLASIPTALSRSLDRRAMNAALQRRTQLGERLRALVDRCEALDAQVRAHAERIERIRVLYGLPEMSPVPTVAAPLGPPPEGIFAGAVLHAERLSAAIEAALARSDALIAALARWEADHPDDARSVPILSPLHGTDAVLVAGFGRGRNPVSGEAELHAGIDFAAPAGAEVRAAAGGVVRWAGEAPPNAGEQWWRLGRIVVVAHGASYRTLYGHCDRIAVRVGQRVATGEVVALVGRSGWPATPRLHFEIRRRDAEGIWQPVDPRRMLLVGPGVAAAPGAAAGRDAIAIPPPALPRVFER
jgi:murein DD-endopeptidase MepM/ murein hydrolase activator NlpD